ncbi:MAG: class C sortase [Lachnospiraceae bacterium]|nr:class C sortase [Lachnospiraceae bacterium]
MKRKSNIFLVIMLLAGISLILYPSVSDWWNSMHQSRAVASYLETVTDLSAEENERMIQEANAYNKELASGSLHLNLTEEEVEEYNSILDVTGTGIMGYIDIPKIKVQLPIYHGTDESILQIAIGHLAGTSLPVGGESTHCVVSGHSGLPSALLFTNLSKLLEGDQFTMSVLDRTLTYEVDQIRIVLPDEVSDLAIEEGEDYCTLVTCTPYGINTHRLLVRGHRVENVKGGNDIRVTADALQIEPIMVVPFAAIPLLLVLLFILLFTTHDRKKSKKERIRIKNYRLRKNQRPESSEQDDKKGEDV